MDRGLLAGGSQSVVVICHSTYEPAGGHMCRSTYIRVNISRLLIFQSLHWHKFRCRPIYVFLYRNICQGYRGV